MKIFKLLILSLLLIETISSCKEDCEKNNGKESFYIETSLEVIDSIEITNNLNFDKIFDSPELIVYQTGFINTDLEKLSLIVYFDNDSIHINLPIKADNHLSISISHSSFNKCLPENLNKLYTWNSLSKNEILYCYYYKLNGCY